MHTQAGGPLNPDEGSIAYADHEMLVELSNTRCVAVTDRRHRDDLARDQLQPLVFAEDPDLDHALVFVRRELPRLLDFSRHDDAPPSVYDCQPTLSSYASATSCGSP